MNLECNITRDLLPLYVEDMISEDGKESVREHIEQCSECKKLLEQMQQPEPEQVHEAEPFKKFRKRFIKHRRNVVTLAVFFTIVAVILVEGIFFLPGGQEMGYALLYLYLLLPSTSLICSCILGRHHTKIKWFAPFIFGAVGLLVPYAVFHTFEWFALWFAFIPSLVGLGIGLLYAFLINKIRRSREKRGRRKYD